ncbi:uncharacterized protein LOC141784490 [Halichoeres trimaculatus]|uniref:uncharacterized protein LOC141784490 n=1 Tax=Halichoeres trimaculatus TaxID=147232 RepID=UPI003D9EEC5F
MALFIISRLLLMALFLRPSTGNEELKKHTTLKPDHSERYQEFCLRMPDDSHWTSSKPVTQPPTSSSQAPKTSEQPTQPNRKSTSQPNTDAVSSSSLMHQTPAYLSTVQHPKSTTPNNQEEVTTEKIRVGMRPLEMVSNPCQCGETEIDPGPEVSELKNLLIHNPTATCRHREFTTRMTDGRKFCVPRETALSYINKELQSLVSSSAGNNGLRDTHPRPVSPCGAKGVSVLTHPSLSSGSC